MVQMEQAGWGGRIAAAVGGALIGGVAMVTLGAAIAPSTDVAVPVEGGSRSDATAEAEPGAIPLEAVPCVARQDAARDAATRAGKELAALQLSERLLEGQLGPMGGLPSPWDADVPDGEREPAVRAALAAAAAELDDVDMLDVHCEEYPCIATAVLHGRSTDFLNRWVDSAGLEARQWSVSGKIIVDGEPGAHGVAILGTALAPEVGERASVRASRVMEALDAR